jgi:CRISPR system Cascade subunit CasC
VTVTRTYIDVHVLQTVPPSNLNRDDTGSPKTAFYGGVRRARVSSQAWKRATRTAFDSVLDRSQLGVRTRRVVELVAEEIERQDGTLSDAERLAAAEGVLGKAGIALKPARKKEAPKESGYLLFLSRQQVHNLAAVAVAVHGGAEYPKNVKQLADTEHSVDLALFGRMVADDTGLNVDASVQVAHAISVHAVEEQFDYFTAVDDHKNVDEEEDAGAGMIGTVEFNSSTLYRYATVDVDGLTENLGDPAAVRAAVEAFLACFVTSMPTGKQNTFANRTLPDAVLVQVRDDQPVNYVGAFEEAIVSTTGRAVLAVDRLAEHARQLDEAYGLQPVAAFAAGPKAGPLGQTRPWGEVVTAVGDVVAARQVAVPEQAPQPA